MQALLTALPQLYAATDPDGVKDALLTIVARLVNVEVVTYDELVPGQAVRLRQLPVTPGVAEALPALFATLKTHPIMPAFHARAALPAKVSDFATLNQFRDTAVYDEVYRPLGVNHQMNLFPRGQEFLNHSVTLSRLDHDFSEEDRQLLGHLSAHFTQAYRNAVAFSDTFGRLGLVIQACATVQKETVFLDGCGRISSMSLRAAGWLNSYFPGERSRSALPSAAKAWLAGSARTCKGNANPRCPREPLIIKKADSRLNIRCYADQAGRRMLLLTEECPLLAPAGLQRIGLTLRESEILRWVAEGKTDSEMGLILAISEHTAHKHVQNILRKLGVSNRATALLRVCELQERV